MVVRTIDCDSAPSAAIGRVGFTPKSSNEVKSNTKDTDIVVRLLVVGSWSLNADVTPLASKRPKKTGRRPGGGGAENARSRSVPMPIVVAT